ncbi:MAG: flagellar hook-basal body complex protein [Terracidiphilus sp.]|jgi:flagellar hook protein FlgE
MPSFYIPLSGLDADSTALNTIANNLSNMSTTGFKTQNTNFSDLFYQQTGTTGSGDQIQVGTGVQVASNSTDFTGGSIASTGVSTDAAINGTGFFVLDNGGGQQLYTRDGNFQISSTGTLESTEGQAVMGYGATNGVISTSGGLTDIVVPTGQVMQPSATSTFGMTENLDSTSAVGTQQTGQVQVYDSLGKTYEATVTYTNLGQNKWSYAITMPDALAAAAATAPAAQTLPVTAAAPDLATITSTLTAATTTPVAGTTAYTFNFGSSSGTLASGSSSGTLATVDTGTSLTITGATTGGTATIAAPTIASGESVSTYAAALQSAMTTAGITGVTATATGGQLVITGATATTSIAGAVKQDLEGATVNYSLGSSATVDPSTNLSITGLTATGVPATIVLPTVTAGESVNSYATALQGALTTAGITNVTVAATAGGQLSITGANMTTSGAVSQDLTAQTIKYNFGSNQNLLATVNSGTNLTISGLTANGFEATTVAPVVTAGETVAQYAAALNQSLADAGIGGVAVTVNGGQLSISGAHMSTSGNLIQDSPASANATGTLSFDANGNLVSPAANLSNITFAGLSDGAAPMNMTWNLFGANGTGEISQTAAASGQSAQTQNGYTSGEYQGFSIGSDGTVTATYSNYQSQVVGQVALATVSNLQGLSDVGSTEYKTTPASGLATVGVAGAGGRGTLEGSSLEASNVNISAEFSDLIVAQRAFEANAKSMTTFDTITQETINMIH